MNSLIVFHVQDANGNPIAGASAHATSLNGDWSSITDAAGNVVDPGTGIAGVSLTPGDYIVTFSKNGYADRALPATIKECGQIRVGLDKAASVLPAPPTRAQICGIKTSLAGLTYDTTQYGPIPAWFYAGLNSTDRARARDTHLGVHDTHIPIGISEAYRESGTLWPAELREGYDYAYDLEAFRAVLMPVLESGLLVDMPLAGDGLSVNADPQQGQYNDPVGKTYGFQWLMNNFERIALALKGDGTPTRPDLTKYIIFRPGWDAVFYGWGGALPQAGARARPISLRWRHMTAGGQAQLKAMAQKARSAVAKDDPQPGRVKAFGELFRRVLPNGYLSIEHTPGNIPCGEGGTDYAPGGLMQTYDTILSEFSTVNEDSCWQIVGRMVSPYHRPPDQPSGDDPNPPFYLGLGNPRGPYFYVAFEPTIGGVYQWCRGQCTLADVQNIRAYLHGLGCSLTG